ncbi:MAG: hypothetical protein LBB15_00135, partial [Puniceicoccales bacterium]|nr:hypothetical protein [Puniceicoccales bacterium]
VFGTGWANVQSNFHGWTIGNFGNTAALTATASSSGNNQALAAVFGAGWADINSNFHGWMIGNFGDNAALTATASSPGSQAFAAVFGTGWATGWANNNSEFSSWRIENFDDHAVLTATASSPSSQAFAAVFGTGWATGWANNNSEFSDWVIGNFGDHAALTAIASSSGNQAFAAVFGTGWANANSEFSGWNIGNFGESLMAFAHARDYSGVFGAGWLKDDGITFSNWTIGDIGANSTLFSTSFCSTIFGSARLNNNASINNWTIGNIGDGATLITYSSNQNFTYTANHDSTLRQYYGSFGSVFGSAFNESLIDNPNNWTVEFRGNALCSSIGDNAGGTTNVHLGTLGGDKNSDFRFYFNAIDAQNPTVTIAALKLDGPAVIEDGKVKLSLSSDQGGGGLCQSDCAWPKLSIKYWAQPNHGQ